MNGQAVVDVDEKCFSIQFAQTFGIEMPQLDGFLSIVGKQFALSHGAIIDARVGYEFRL